MFRRMRLKILVYLIVNIELYLVGNKIDLINSDDKGTISFE